MLRLTIFMGSSAKLRHLGVAVTSGCLKSKHLDVAVTFGRLIYDTPGRRGDGRSSHERYT